MDGKYKFYFLSIFLLFAQSATAMNELFMRFQELIGTLENLNFDLNKTEAKRTPQDPEKKPQEKPTQKKEYESPQSEEKIEKEQEVAECFAGIKIIEAEMADFQKNEKNWNLKRIEIVLDMIEKHRHPGCSYSGDVDAFVKKLRQREDSLDPCTQQKEAIEKLMKESSETLENLSDEHLKKMKADIDSFLKGCQSQENIANFYEKIKKALAGPKKNKQEEYEELTEKLYKAAGSFRKNSSTFTNTQLRNYQKDIDTYIALYKDKSITKDDEDEAKRKFNTINAFQGSIKLSLGVEQITSNKKELKNLLTSIEKIKESYLANPTKYIEDQVRIYEKERDEKVNQLIVQMRKKGDEGIEEYQAADLVEKPIEIFIEKNNVIFKILAEIKRYKEGPLSEELQEDMIAFIKQLLTDAFNQFETEKKDLKENYSTLLKGVPDVFRKELLLKLTEAYLSKVNRYKMYSTFFGVKLKSDIDQIEQSIKLKKADTLAALIDNKIKSGSSYRIDQVIDWFNNYKKLQSEFKKPVSKAVEENMKQIFNKKEKNILDALNNEIILLIEPYKKSGKYEWSTIESSKIDLLLNKLGAFKQATDNYVNKTEDVSYAHESLARFKGVFQQLVLMIYYELVEKLKPYQNQKAGTKEEITYDFSKINQSDKEQLFALIDAYKSRLDEYKKIIEDTQFHKDVLLRVNKIQGLLVKETK